MSRRYEFLEDGAELIAGEEAMFDFCIDTETDLR